MTLTTYLTIRKSYVYNFFPVKDDEARPVAPNPSGSEPRLNRALVEIRDVHPPPQFDPRYPWRIRKSLTHSEVASGMMMVSFEDTFNHILRYWKICMAKHLAMLGSRVVVVLWDFTNERHPRKYDGVENYFQMTQSGHCVLSCEGVMRDRNLKPNDNIGLYWECRQGCFCIKLFSSGGRF